jgi:hypothetical protein
LLVKKNIFIFWCTGGGKCAPEGKHEPSCKRTATDLEVKIRVTHKYEGASGSIVVKALCYKPEGRGFESRCDE